MKPNPSFFFASSSKSKEIEKKNLPDFFAFLETIEPQDRKEIERRHEIVKANRLETIIQQDAEGDVLYIIEKGVVEVVSVSPNGQQTRVMTYLSRGDFFGEMSILTHGRRTASIRACEEVQLWKLSGIEFLRLVKKIPMLGYYLSCHLAKRLAHLTRESNYQSYCVDFGGNLLNFDMLQIFQTIASSGEIGELRIINKNNDLIGSFFFHGTRVTQARYAHLNGIEAVWQVFLQSHPDGTFAFQATGKPSVPYDTSSAIDMDGMNLLMQSATKRDCFEALPQEWKSMSGNLGRVTEILSWEHLEYAKIAQTLWSLIAKKPQLLDSLWRRMNVCSLHLCEVSKQLVETGQACYHVEPAALNKAF